MLEYMLISYVLKTQSVLTNKFNIITEEELEPLDSPPPSPIILCCEWIAMKICGYSPPDKEEIISDGTKKKKLKR